MTLLHTHRTSGVRECKDPGPEDPALAHPWKGVLFDLADFNRLLGYWYWNT